MKILNSWLKKFNLVKPAERGAYAVNTGLYVGEFLVFVKENSKGYCFISLPKLLKRIIPKDKFEVGIKNKIITLVEVLPKNIFAYCQAAYKD